MSLVGHKARNHPQQVGAKGVNRTVDDRATPPEFFGPLSKRFGGFTVDVAASAENTKCARFYNLETNGLDQSWAGERVWCNPPYSNIRPWVEKAWLEAADRAECIVLLLPANRTEQRWWQELVEPYRDRGQLRGLRNRLALPLTVEFLPGRLRFIRVGSTIVGPNERPPFGCCLAIWQWERERKAS